MDWLSDLPDWPHHCGSAQWPDPNSHLWTDFLGPSFSPWTCLKIWALGWTWALSLGLPCLPQLGEKLTLGDEGSANPGITIGSWLAFLFGVALLLLFFDTRFRCDLETSNVFRRTNYHKKMSLWEEAASSLSWRTRAVTSVWILVFQGISLLRSMQRASQILKDRLWNTTWTSHWNQMNRGCQNVCGKSAIFNPMVQGYVKVFTYREKKNHREKLQTQLDIL